MIISRAAIVLHLQRLRRGKQSKASAEKNEAICDEILDICLDSLTDAEVERLKELLKELPEERIKLSLKLEEKKLVMSYYY